MPEKRQHLYSNKFIKYGRTGGDFQTWRVFIGTLERLQHFTCARTEQNPLKKKEKNERFSRRRNKVSDKSSHDTKG